MQIFNQLLSILAFLLSIDGIVECINLLHPQHYICNSDIVILIRILKNNLLADGTNNMSVMVDRQIEEYNKFGLSLENRKIFIELPYCASIKEIKIGEIYVMTLHFNPNQNKLSVDKCGYFKLYSHLTIEESHGLSGNYKRGCNCKIRYCLKGCQKKNRMECIWNSENWYLMASVTCLPIDHDECSWSRHGVKINVLNNTLDNNHILHKRTFHVF